MTKTRLYKGNFPDPEFYRYIGSYRDWKVYSYRTMNDGGFYRLIKVKLVSMVPTKRANLFLNYSLSLRRFVLCKDRKHFGDAYPFELITLEVDMEKYVRNLEDKEEVGE